MRAENFDEKYKTVGVNIEQMDYGTGPAEFIDAAIEKAHWIDGEELTSRELELLNVDRELILNQAVSDYSE